MATRYAHVKEESPYTFPFKNGSIVDSFYFIGERYTKAPNKSSVNKEKQQDPLAASTHQRKTRGPTCGGTQRKKMN